MNWIVVILMFSFQQKTEAIRCLRSSNNFLQEKFDVAELREIQEKIQRMETENFDDQWCFAEIFVTYESYKLNISTDRNRIDDLRQRYMWYDTYLEVGKNNRLIVMNRFEFQCNFDFCDQKYIISSLTWLLNYTYQEYNSNLTYFIKAQEPTAGLRKRFFIDALFIEKK